MKTTHELTVTIVLESQDEEAKVSDMSVVLADLGLQLRENITIYVHPDADYVASNAVEAGHIFKTAYTVTDIKCERTYSHAESRTPSTTTPTVQDVVQARLLEGKLPPKGQ